MTPSLSTTHGARVRHLAAVSAVLAALALTGCGKDDSAPKPARVSDVADGGVVSPDGDGEVIDELGQALGDESGVDEAIDALGDDGLNDVLGQAATGSIGAEDYVLEDGRLVFVFEEEAAEKPSACLIATTAADGVGATATIVMRFADGDVVCP
ncbi:hypothetical protein [Nocardioides sp. R-C-SC26]|uniref:hypothetical protein n=1 Tax=Nocardioides sp. R-C-SC26 TaxID=2870414 RepID=UPI001E44D2DD|nr:hypothetical protein [Nocardioides sp. R-C-SC26]